MVDDPDFEPEFYEEQVNKMVARYSTIFKKWHLSWDAYWNYVCSALRNRTYWIWIYLCGFEKFVQEHGEESNNRHNRLYKDADERIRRIVGDYFKIQEYVNSL